MRRFVVVLLSIALIAIAPFGAGPSQATEPGATTQPQPSTADQRLSPPQVNPKLVSLSRTKQTKRPKPGSVRVRFEGRGKPRSPVVTLTNTRSKKKFVLRPGTRKLPPGTYVGSANAITTDQGTWIPQVYPQRIRITRKRGADVKVIYGTQVAPNTVVGTDTPSVSPEGVISVIAGELQVGQSYVVFGSDGQDTFTGRVVSLADGTATLERIPYLEAIPYVRAIADSTSNQASQFRMAKAFLKQRTCAGGLDISFSLDDAIFDGTEVEANWQDGVTYARMQINLITNPMDVPAGSVQGNCTLEIESPDFALAAGLFVYASGSIAAEIDANFPKRPGPSRFKMTAGAELTNGTWRGFAEPTRPEAVPAQGASLQMSVPKIGAGVFVTPVPKALRSGGAFSVDFSVGGQINASANWRAPYTDETNSRCAVGTWIELGAELLARARIQVGWYEKTGSISQDIARKRFFESRCARPVTPPRLPAPDQQVPDPGGQPGTPEAPRPNEDAPSGSTAPVQLRMGEIMGVNYNGWDFYLGYSFRYPSGLSSIMKRRIIGPLTSSNEDVIAVVTDSFDACGPGRNLYSCNIYALRVGESTVCGVDADRPSRKACLRVGVPSTIDGTSGDLLGLRFTKRSDIGGIPPATSVVSGNPTVLVVRESADSFAVAYNYQGAGGTSRVCVTYGSGTPSCQDWQLTYG